MLDSLKNTHAYYMQRHRLLYDTFLRRGKVLKRAIKLPQYLGTEYQCPVCGIGLRAFRPLEKSNSQGVEKLGPIDPALRSEALNPEASTCPRCDAIDYERLTAIYLERVFAAFDPNRAYRLVEFAPGEALQRKLKRYPFIAYRGADLSGPIVEENVDLTHMVRFGDASIDIVLCFRVLDHIPEDRKAMSEIRRVLRTDGFAIVEVPLLAGLDETREGPITKSEAVHWKDPGMGDKVRQYGKRDFLARLKGAGLRVEQLGVEYFRPEVLRRAGINENLVLYVVRPR
jgi:SAM-dependent methyltransferase